MLHLKNINDHFFYIKLGSFDYNSYICSRLSLSFNYCFALGVGGTLGTLANGVNVGGGTTHGTLTSTFSQRVVAIPPMSVIELAPKYFVNRKRKGLYTSQQYLAFFKLYHLLFFREY